MKWNFLAQILKKFLYFFQRKPSFIFWKNRTFSYFRKMEPCTCKPKPQKTKKKHPKKIPYISGNGIF